ncbi:hypothetical protein [Actinomadura madurae]|uniref:hypothetical protein n=1 Tax=Actinomadura madurae TaxID=1993 RepID=UPI002026421F|nr:hypothetical protein [Actinomadura madurae]MCP9950192.1 hypothetical protein [Actinomadura madurae]MCP9966960.1 hypothetical protein [Actinomadura madurae]MCP9979431.1 hypothetical protein [Actinomadura madurae]MCQ0009039.1 hypothetical protein [Actinomadura madurae]URM95751.1 hypothetical protein LUW76_16205 [Actinomadura madurae]
MRAVFSAWFTASLLAVMALLALKALAPTTGQGEPVDEYAQVLRVHLPWLLFCVLMAVAAGSYVREWANGLGRVVAALPVPVLGSFVAASLGIPFSDTAVGVVLHLIEASLGVVLGLALSKTLSQRWAAETVNTRERGTWRKNR